MLGTNLRTYNVYIKGIGGIVTEVPANALTLNFSNENTLIKANWFYKTKPKKELFNFLEISKTFLCIFYKYFVY